MIEPKPSKLQVCYCSPVDECPTYFSTFCRHQHCENPFHQCANRLAEARAKRRSRRLELPSPIPPSDDQSYEAIFASYECYRTLREASIDVDFRTEGPSRDPRRGRQRITPHCRAYARENRSKLIKHWTYTFQPPGSDKVYTKRQVARTSPSVSPIASRSTTPEPSCLPSPSLARPSSCQEQGSMSGSKKPNNVTTSRKLS